MKFSDSMRFPYPILSEITDDYSVGQFGCEYIIEEQKNGALVLTSNITIDESPKIVELIQQGKVAVGYYIMCRDTYYDVLQPAILGHHSVTIPEGTLFGTVKLRPVAWTTQDNVDLSASTLDPEFSIQPLVSKGSIVALDNEHRFSMDPKKYQSVGSVFELVSNDTAEPGIFEVDTENSRIKIVTDKNTFERISQLRDTTDRNYLLCSLFLPALTEVLARVSKAEDEGKMWYQVLNAKYDELGLDFTATSPVRDAQTLLQQPLNEFFELMERV